MKQVKVNVKVVPDLRRTKDKGKYPLKLRVTYKSDRRYYGTSYDATLKEWEIINSKETDGRLRKIRNAIAILEEKADKCCETIIPFSFTGFENEFFEKKIIFENVAAAYTFIKDELKLNNQFGTMVGYETAQHSLEKFRKNLRFEDITKEFLQEYERWMLGKGKSITTVGIYLKTLRVMMNLAKSNGIIKPESYPFGRRKYMIPASRNIKKGLDIEHIEKIFNYETEPFTSMDQAKDFWIFSYLCNGINMMDIAHLKWSEVQEDKIVFERSKTKRTKRENPIKIIALRNEHIDRVIKKWGFPKNIEYDSFVFEIIFSSDEPQRARAKVQQFTKVINDWLRKMGEDLKLPIKLTTYVARHSFATMLVRGGAPMAFASQTLGHSNILTTQRYFAGFDLAAHAEYARALTNFKPSEAVPTRQLIPGS
jgi:integrase